MSAPRPDTPTRSRGDDGFALLIVLWLIVVLALQVGALTMSVRDGVRLVESSTAIARGEALMHAAIETAVARLTARDPKQRWLPDGAPRTLTIAGIALEIVIAAENGRIDLNTADPALLAGLARSLGLTEREAATMADRIADWRDPDSERRQRGAEDRDYRRAGLDHGAADQPFLDTGDLTRVLGIAPELAHGLAPHVTVFNADGKINPRLASETVLRALPDIPRATLDQVLQLRRKGGEAALAIDTLLAPARQHLSSGVGPTYRIRMTTRGDRRTALGSGETIIVLGLDTATPYRTLAWRFSPSTLASD